MNSDLAIHISECLKDVDGITIHWRAIKKYADDWEQNNNQNNTEKSIQNENDITNHNPVA